MLKFDLNGFCDKNWNWAFKYWPGAISKLDASISMKFDDCEGHALQRLCMLSNVICKETENMEKWQCIQSETIPGGKQISISQEKNYRGLFSSSFNGAFSRV